MPRIRNIMADAIKGNLSGLILELDDGSLLISTFFNNPIVAKSLDGGGTWTTKYSYATSSWNTRLVYHAANGNLFFGTIDSNTSGEVSGVIVRSTDNGETWTPVATSEGSGWWHMCEDSSGNLYASEYSEGLGDANELYAYNVWKSSDHGATWSKFHSEPKQSTPGAKDGIRHTHLIGCDSADNLYISFGDTPAYLGNAGNIFRLNSDGTLGEQIASLVGNGWPSFAQGGGANIRLFGGDLAPFAVFAYNPANNAYSLQMNIARDFGPAFPSPVLAMAKGRNGVIYALTNASSPSILPYLFASTDSGATWQALQFTNTLFGATALTLNASGPSNRIYISPGGPGTNYYSLPDYTPTQLSRRFRVIDN